MGMVKVGRIGFWSSIPRQVLIAPLLGCRKDHDWDRLDRTIEGADATRVRLLTMPPEIDKGGGSREHVRAKLKEMKKHWRRFEWDETHADLLDFEATLQAFAKLFREEDGNLVSVALVRLVVPAPRRAPLPVSCGAGAASTSATAATSARRSFSPSGSGCCRLNLRRRPPLPGRSRGIAMASVGLRAARPARVR